MYPHLKEGYQEGVRYGEPASVPTHVRPAGLRYLASITAMDDAIGEVLDFFDSNNLTSNTLLIFFSDNGGGGGSDNSPLRGGKAKMFEGGVRVPCIVRWPGVIRPGTVCKEFLTSMEIFPTVLGAAGAGLPQGVTLDGVDMKAALQGNAGAIRTEMFWERRADRAARVGKWKWVESEAGNGLFDLESDIGETTDLSREKPEILKMVRQRFEAWKRAMAVAEPRGPFRDY